MLQLYLDGEKQDLVWALGTEGRGVPQFSVTPYFWFFSIQFLPIVIAGMIEGNSVTINMSAYAYTERKIPYNGVSLASNRHSWDVTYH